jgi:hypothetical protein
VTITDDRAAEIVAKLVAGGIRATTDPGALNAPAVLVIPVPKRTYDVGCGFTATWTLHALAPAPSGADRTTAALLNGMVDTVAGIFPVEEAQPGAYILGPNTHPSISLTFTEVLSP